jgi:hypothetical protein
VGWRAFLLCHSELGMDSIFIMQFEGSTSARAAIRRTPKWDSYVL